MKANRREQIFGLIMCLIVAFVVGYVFMPPEAQVTLMVLGGVALAVVISVALIANFVRDMKNLFSK